MSDGVFKLDQRAQDRDFDRAAAGYDPVAVLQAEVRTRLLDRLQWVRLSPALSLDLGSATGHGAAALAALFPDSRVIAVDRSPAMLRIAAARAGPLPAFDTLCADATRLPLPDASVDLLFSNLLLHCLDDPDPLFAEARRVLKPGGLFTFTGLGPDTLRELRSAWLAADGHSHVHRFIDMHDLGDGLVRAGLVEPVMDIEYFTVTYRSVEELVTDLRALGETNRSASRPRGLTGRGKKQRMVEAYEAHRRDGRLPATCEVVFGHAWGPVAPYRPRGLPGEVLVPVGSIRRR